MPSMLTIPTEDGSPLEGYLSLPPEGAGPGLLILPASPGLTTESRATADEFAEEGYVALVPDLPALPAAGSHPNGATQCEPGSPGPEPRDDADHALARIGSAFWALRSHAACTGKVAVLGYGPGGLLTVPAAARYDMAAVVCYDPAGIATRVHAVSEVRCPMVLHFGGKNPDTPPEVIERVRAAVAGRDDVSVAVYPDAGSGFASPGQRGFHRPSASIARSRTLGLLRAQMGPVYDLSALWDRHCACEFGERNVDATMDTMVAEPYVNHVPTMTGGVGYTQLHRFYKNHFLARLPRDTKIVPISRTVGADRVVDELLFCFTHDTEIDFLLPGVPPTGKYVEAPTIAVVHFRGNKIAHEHIYWDQASVLVQVGLLDPAGLPVAGVATAQKLVDEGLPSNTLMARWDESANGA